MLSEIGLVVLVRGKQSRSSNGTLLIRPSFKVEAPLKDKNRLKLATVMSVNFILFYGFTQNGSLLTGQWSNLLDEITKILPAGIGLTLIGIINGQFSADLKSRIVFLRWKNPLPGCDAFTHYATADPRVDLVSIENKCGPLPTDPAKQNALWYKLYKTVETDASVIQAHRDFLFARDYASLALMMGIVLGVLGFILIPSTSTAFLFEALLAAQFLLAARAGRNHGKRLVTTVLALKGAGR